MVTAELLSEDWELLKIGANWYAYNRNIPLYFQDPTGLNPVLDENGDPVVGTGQWTRTTSVETTEYNREDSVKYAKKYDKGSNHSYYISRLPASLWSGGDCANFASQCLHAGGQQMNIDWYFMGNAYDLMGRLVEGSYTKSWAVANVLASYLRSSRNILNYEIVILLSEFSSEAMSNAAQFVRPGDLVGWSRDGGETIHHFGVVTYSGTGSIRYSAHTISREDYEINEMSPGDNAIIFFLLLDYINSR